FRGRRDSTRKGEVNGLFSAHAWPGAFSLTHERGGNHAQADSSEYGLGSALDAEFGQNMTNMEFDGLLEEMQVAGDLFIGVPLCEQAEHIHFTGGQGFKTLGHADGT